MRIIIAWLMLCVLVVGIILHKIADLPNTHSDVYIRDRVIKLQGDKGGCSGIQVQAPSGSVYILSARHCKAITSTGTITATDEQGHTKKVMIIAVDEASDLLLLSPMSNKFITISDKLSIHEHIHTLTHGNMQPTYRTDGEALADLQIGVVLREVETNEEAAQCEKDGGKISIGLFSAVCYVTLNLRAGTAWVVPGSSGGAVLNEKGQLVGIVSVGGGFFAGYVRLQDINKFLEDK